LINWNPAFLFGCAVHVQVSWKHTNERTISIRIENPSVVRSVIFVNVNITVYLSKFEIAPDTQAVPSDHLLLDSAPNLGPLISRWEINKFENCGYKSVRILEVLKLLFHLFFNFSSSQRDMSGPILGDLSNNGWLGVHKRTYYIKPNRNP
jgi:hypothetical protein